MSIVNGRIAAAERIPAAFGGSTAIAVRADAGDAAPVRREDVAGDVEAIAMPIVQKCPSNVTTRIRHASIVVSLIALTAAGWCSATSRAPAATISAVTVETEDGALRGSVHDGVASFKGIPFAAAPVGELRWRDPQPVRHWSGVRDARAYGASCIQPPSRPEEAGGDPGALSEDCLYLNVWMPMPHVSMHLPVIVWIPGGAYSIGSARFSLYDGAPLAARGAVFVNANYRLAQLGFFVHPALEREHPRGTANYGLLDQIAVLQWVHRNIARFGGDPDNVTIAGESAGGKSVLALYAAPRARGLFARGVAMSTYAVPDASLATARERGIAVANRVGLPGARATVAQLRAVPATTFAALGTKQYANAPVPIAGDAVLPATLERTFASGREAPLPLIIGSTSDDVSVAAAFRIDPHAVLQRIRGAHVVVGAFYPGVTDQRELARQAARDVVFTMPARWTADRHAKIARTYRYYFDYVAEARRATLPHGVPHGLEIAYMLDTLGVDEYVRAMANDRDRAYARTVADYVFAFAENGRPRALHGPAWPNHTAARDETLVFGHTISAQHNFMRTRLNVLIGLLKLATPVRRGR